MKLVWLFIIVVGVLAGCSNNPKQADIDSKREEIPQFTIGLADDALMDETFLKENFSEKEAAYKEVTQAVDNQNAGIKKQEMAPLKMEIKLPDNRPSASLNLRYSKKVYDFWIDYLTNKFKGTFQRHIGNALRSRDTVFAILSEHKLPRDLFYVALIESGFNQQIKSRAGAVGPWQFMKSTARHYGLRVDRKVDERRDLVKSTHAASRYFRDLYNIFGSWEFALLAYNKGEYGVIRAIRKGNSRNYQELVNKKLLPQETVYYIPKIVAARDIFNNMDKFGLSPVVENPPRFDEVESKEAATLVKKDNRSKVKSLIYKVRSGDNLIAIAKRFKTTPEQVIKTNSLKTRELLVDQKLKIPHKVSYYVVRKGDSLQSIAQKFGLSVGKILSYNSLDSRKIYPRQKLMIPVL